MPPVQVAQGSDDGRGGRAVHAHSHHGGSRQECSPLPRWTCTTRFAERAGMMLSRYRYHGAAAIVLARILVAPVDLAAQRVRDEVVELSSGDRVTGEIRGLDRSQLTVRTIDLGTVQVRWQRVVRLNSNRTLEIELVDGRRLQSSIASPTPGALQVSGSAGTAIVDLASIVVIRPVAQTGLGNSPAGSTLG